VLETFRKALLTLMVVTGPLAFLVVAIEAQAEEAHKNSLGRGAFMIGMAVAAAFVWRLLRPNGWVMRRTIGRSRASLLYRLRYEWFLTAFVLPLVLIALAAAGYYYTALQLAWRLTQTFWLVLAVIGLRAVLKRWLLGAVGRLMARRSRPSPAEPAPPEDLPGPAAPARPATDPDAAGQVRQAVRLAMVLALLVGVWLIWIDALPALGIFRRVKLWQTTAKVSEQATTADGKAVARTVERIVPVTLADAGLAVLILVGTVLAARKAPPVLEVLVLRRLHVDPGGRFAITAISRYAIMVIGVVIACGQVGMSWSSVQWLVAAMTVGLAFGLQEIFANFVSGLIILFERPIRIGDTVTIGQTAGTVSRIRIRATTITDWDRKELIVPNKEFVTGRLINWTLSDQVLRVVVPVGIAYGSDTELAQKLLLETAQADPLVLDDPAPIVLFSAFGDNSLEFELRAHISGFEGYHRVRHTLHMAIDKAFRQAGITIAFPQRDTHLDTLRPLDVRIVSEGRRRPGREGQAPEKAD